MAVHVRPQARTVGLIAITIMLIESVASFVSAMFVEAPSIVVFVLMQMSLGLTLKRHRGLFRGRWSLAGARSHFGFRFHN